MENLILDWRETRFIATMDRKFKIFEPKICYDRPATCLTDNVEYDKKRDRAMEGTLVDSLIIPKKSARTWTMQKGDLCKITLIEGSQVGLLSVSVNFFFDENLILFHFMTKLGW